MDEESSVVDPHVADVELSAPLVPILERYYRVQGKNFFELSPVDAYKHQCLHLAKLIKKLTRFLFYPSTEARHVVHDEVVPDLLIYAQELLLKARVSWPSGAVTSQGSHPIRRCLAAWFPHTVSDSNVEEIFAMISSATASLADICDEDDHGQESAFSVVSDAALPLLEGAAALTYTLGVDVDEVYTHRLSQMKVKYEQWS